MIRRPVPDDHPRDLLVQHLDGVDGERLAGLSPVVGLQHVEGCLVAVGILDELQAEGSVLTCESEDALGEAVVSWLLDGPVDDVDHLPGPGVIVQDEKVAFLDGLDSLDELTVDGTVGVGGNR
jgi:hypothetical protein